MAEYYKKDMLVASLMEYYKKKQDEEKFVLE